AAQVRNAHLRAHGDHVFWHTIRSYDFAASELLLQIEQKRRVRGAIARRFDQSMKPVMRNHFGAPLLFEFTFISHVGWNNVCSIGNQTVISAPGRCRSFRSRETCRLTVRSTVRRMRVATSFTATYKSSHVASAMAM